MDFLKSGRWNHKLKRRFKRLANSDPRGLGAFLLSLAALETRAARLQRMVDILG